jgi:hypothetical protein
MGDWSEMYNAGLPFAAPILVAIEEATGLAAVHFVDSYCTIPGGSAPSRRHGPRLRVGLAISRNRAEGPHP